MTRLLLSALALLLAVPASAQTTTTVSVGDFPNAVAVDVASGQAFVTNRDDDAVTVIDTGDLSTTTVTVGDFPNAVAVDVASGQAFVANFSDGTVTVIDTGDLSTTTITVGSIPTAVAVDAASGQAFVANFSDGTVTVIDTGDLSTTTVTVGAGPTAVAVDVASGQAFVANRNDDTMTVIDTGDLSTTTVTVGDRPSAVAVDAASGQAFVANLFDGTVTVIDTGDLSTTTVTVGDFPSAVAVDAASGQAFVVNESSEGVGSVTVIDTGDLSTTTVTVGAGPSAVAVDAAGGQAFVTNRDDGTVTVIATGDLSTTIVDVGEGPNAVAVDAASGQTFVTDGFGDTVTVIAPPPPATISADLVVDTAADDQAYTPTSRAECTDGVLDGDCTLREAILVANDFTGEPDLDTIGFEILDTFGAVNGIATISPLSALPALEDDGIEIDGTTQTGSAPATATVEAVINVVLNGSSLTTGAGLTIQSNGGLVRGLAVVNFPLHGIVIEGGGFGLGNAIAGNTIGVGADGSSGPNGGHGVLIDGDPNNTIGGADPADANTIGFNGSSGIYIQGSGASGNSVLGNYVGTNRAGANLGNTTYGLELGTPIVPGFSVPETEALKPSLGSPSNRLGGVGDGEGNTIGHNGNHGIYVQNRSDGAEIAGNWIGTNAAGDDLGNGGNGVQLTDNTSGSGTVFLRDNRIGHNTGQGIEVTSSSSVSIFENAIGADADGALFGNGQSGIYVVNSVDASISDNTIGDNTSSGVAASGTDGLSVSGNWIGTNANGDDLGNAAGVSLLSNVSGSRIGGDSGNTIAFNGGAGIRLSATALTDNAILGNSIYDNDGLGIDLEGGTEDTFGVTDNDRDDPDNGPNDLQNYPEITAAAQTDTGADVTFTLSTSTDGPYRVELFASDDPDASGFGEGARLVGSTTVQPSFGFASATVPVTGVGAGDVITATATPDRGEGSFGGTSEFSRAVALLPTVQFATPTSVEAEEGDTVDLEVTLSAPAPAGGTTVEIALVEDENSATTTDDLDGFGAQTETVSFTAGETTKTVTITITDDGAAEDAETFRLDLRNATGASIAQPTRFTLEVEASEQTATVTFATTEFSAREGQTTTVAATLTTGDGQPLGSSASFTLTQVDGSADNDDFAPFTAGNVAFDGDFPETLTAPAGTPSGTVFQIPVPLEDDGEVEGEEIANIEVTSDDATVVNGDLTLTIEDAPVVQFASAAYVAEEGDTVEIVVTLSEGAQGNESVDVVFTDGAPDTADSDDLDGFASETIEFSEGDLTATVTIDIPRDRLNEDDEMFTFSLQNPTGLGIGDVSETELTIALSVATVGLEVSAYDADEGDDLEVEVFLSDAAQGGETVDISLSRTSGPDATSADLGGFTSTTVTFESGETSASFTVSITRDGIAEDAETFTLSIDDTSGLEVGEDQTVITVAPSRTGVQFADAAFMVAEGSTAVLTLTLGSPAIGGETVEVAFASGTPDGATLEDVGGFETQTVTFAAGDTSATVEVEITDDGRTEDAESFTFRLQNATGLEVGDAAETVVTVDPSATSISFASGGEQTVGEGVGTVDLEIVFGEPLAEDGSFDIVLASSSDDAGDGTSAARSRTNAAGTEDLDGFESVTVEVEAGATSATVQITVTDDLLPEGTETFEFEIRNATGGGPNGLALGNAGFTLTVTDNDNPVAGNDSEVEESTIGLAYPNPTAGSAWLEVAVDTPQRVRMTVLDAVGRVVATYDLEVSGVERILVGEDLAPGTYLIQVSGTTVSATRQLTVAR